MGHFANIDGTAHKVVGGMTMVDGTEREILLGKTLIDGTKYDIPFDIKITFEDNSSTGSGHGYVKVNGQTYNFDDEGIDGLTVRVPYGSEIYAYVGYNTYGSSYIYFNDELVGGQAAGYPYVQSYEFVAISDINIRFRMTVTAATDTTTTKKFYNRIYITEE